MEKKGFISTVFSHVILHCPVKLTPLFHLMDKMSSVSCCITEPAVSSHHVLHLTDSGQEESFIECVSIGNQLLLQTGCVQAGHTQEECWWGGGTGEGGQLDMACSLSRKY